MLCVVVFVCILLCFFVCFVFLLRCVLCLVGVFVCHVAFRLGVFICVWLSRFVIVDAEAVCLC